MLRLLRVSGVFGASSVFVMLLGVVTSKTIAVAHGPEALGRYGVLGATLAVGVTLFGMGIGSSGVRYVAAAKTDQRRLSEARRAVVLGSVTMALVGAIALLLGGHWLRTVIPGFSGGPATLALAVTLAASVVAAGLAAILNGMEQVTQLAIVRIVGSLGTALSVILILGSADDFRLTLVLGIGPILMVVASTLFLRRKSLESPEPQAVVASLRRIIGLGAAFAVSVLVTTSTQLYVRLLVGTTLGAASLGLFQASWTVSSVYLGFILASMAVEYYPRLSRMSSNDEALNKAANLQIKASLVLATPVVLLAILLAPTVLRLLYAEDFANASLTLRWLLVGDTVRVSAWALGFLLLAKGSRWRFLLAEVVWNFCYLALVGFTMGTLGLVSVGAMYLAAYFVYLIAVLASTRAATGFVLSAPNIRQALTFTVIALLLLALETVSPGLTPISYAITAATIVYCVIQVVAQARNQEAAQ